MGHHPDGMAEMRHREMQNMKAARQEPGFTHDVVAVDSDGNTVFETEALFANEVEDALEDYPEGEDAPEGVDHYEVQKR